MTELDLAADVVTLTADLCDRESVSGDEQGLADAIEAALRRLDHLVVTRDGNTVVARTELGRPERVILAGHIDTVPLTDPPNLPTRREGEELHGRGTVDMKGGVAVQLRIAAEVTEPTRDITFVFYDCEEVEAERNGLARVGRNRPELLEGDFAVLLEPTSGAVEGGCKGTLRVEVTARGVAAHSARPWNGVNAIHEAGTLLGRLTAYDAQTVEVEGLDYHEALSAVGIRGGIAGNVIPDTLRGHRQLPLRPEQDQRGGPRARARAVRGLRRGRHRRRGRRPARPAPARGQGVRRGAGRARVGQGGLDRRRAVLGASASRR